MNHAEGRGIVWGHIKIYIIQSMHIKVTKLILFVIFFILKKYKKGQQNKTSRVDMYSLEGCTGLSLILSPEANSSTARGWKVSKASLVQMFTTLLQSTWYQMCTFSASRAVSSYLNLFHLNQTYSVQSQANMWQVGITDIPQKMLILQTVARTLHCPWSLNYHAII